MMLKRHSFWDWDQKQIPQSHRQRSNFEDRDWNQNYGLEMAYRLMTKFWHWDQSALENLTSVLRWKWCGSWCKVLYDAKQLTETSHRPSSNSVNELVSMGNQVNYVSMENSRQNDDACVYVRWWKVVLHHHRTKHGWKVDVHSLGKSSHCCSVLSVSMMWYMIDMIRLTSAQELSEISLVCCMEPQNKN